MLPPCGIESRSVYRPLTAARRRFSEVPPGNIDGPRARFFVPNRTRTQ
ncbi:hypothetical protein CSE45_3568 [Citreicella sp. SE45]|nr:hypothetical protein CSE45_3568 [Citreicella sp. SE45]